MRDKRGIAVEQLIFLIVAVLVIVIIISGIVWFSWSGAGRFFSFLPGFEQTDSIITDTEIFRFNLVENSVEYYDGTQGIPFDEIIVNGKKIESDSVYRAFFGHYYHSKRSPGPIFEEFRLDKFYGKCDVYPKDFKNRLPTFASGYPMRLFQHTASTAEEENRAIIDIFTDGKIPFTDVNPWENFAGNWLKKQWASASSNLNLWKGSLSGKVPPSDVIKSGNVIILLAGGGGVDSEGEKISYTLGELVVTLDGDIFVRGLTPESRFSASNPLGGLSFKSHYEYLVEDKRPSSSNCLSINASEKKRIVNAVDDWRDSVLKKPMVLEIGKVEGYYCVKKINNYLVVDLSKGVDNDGSC